MTDNPEFKEVRDYPGYAVSEHGRVVSFRRGRFRELKPTLKSNGYHQLMLCSDGGRVKAKLLHHVVLETFVSKKPDGMETRHLNGIKTDNRIDNLKWGTPMENKEDRVRHRTNFKFPIYRGREVATAKLDEQKVREILTSQAPARVFAQKFGVSKTAVKYVRQRINWSHIELAPAL